MQTGKKRANIIEVNAMRMKLIREIMNAKARFLAITLVVAIGVMIFIASSMSYRNLKTSYEYTYSKLNFADFRVKSDRIPEYIVGKVRKVPGVKMVTPRVRKDLNFIMPDGKHLMGRVTGIPMERPIVDGLYMQEGRYFKEGDKFVCIAESHFAKFYKLHPGDKLIFSKKGNEIPIEIIGIAGSPEYLVLAGEKGDFSPLLSASAMAILFTPIEDARWMADMPRLYNQVLFRVKDPKHMDPVIAKVEDIMKYTGIKDVVTQEQHPGNKMLKMDLDAFKSFALFFPLLFLGIACFSIYILLSRLVHTQRPFIGVMRAMGYTRSQILRHYISFALAIGVLGALLGMLTGYGLTYVITGFYTKTIGIPLVRIRAYWIVLFQGAFLSLIFCVVAGLLPALKSARTDPAKAMRGEISERAFRMPILERVVPALTRVPLFLKVPVRNMFRNRRRTAFTLIGLIFSVMLVLIFLATLDTASDALSRGFNLNNRFDMVAIFVSGSESVNVYKMRSIEGVTDVEPTIGFNCKVNWDGDSAETMMMGLLPETSMKRFFTADRREVSLSDRHVLMNQWFHLKKGLKVGDRVTISTSLRKESFVVGDFIEEPMGNLIYMTRDDVSELLAHGRTARGGYYIKVRPGYAKKVRDSLQKLPGMATMIELEEVHREIDQYMNLMYIIIYVMLVFALMMAFTLTFNTITINILEREREIATMRTIGTQSWKISAMTTLENVIFGIISIVPGCILGVWVAKYAMSLQQSDFFTMSLVVSPWSYVTVAAGIILILLICQVPSLRYVKKVELARATKERGAG